MNMDQSAAAPAPAHRHGSAVGALPPARPAENLAPKLALAACLLGFVAGCGGGDSPGLWMDIGAGYSTSAATGVTNGSMSLPEGSYRTGGDIFMPMVSCRLGEHTLAWSNAANGSTGQGYALWDCSRDLANWSAVGIPLAIGANRITVTLTDAGHSAQAVVTITRTPS
jgi:hypothetical protein